MLMRSKKVICVNIEKNKTAYEALQLGAVSNSQYDAQLQSGKLPYGWYWTGTVVAYMKAGEPFGKVASFADPDTSEIWQMDVPKKYQGKKNICLIADPGGFDHKKDGSTVTIRLKKISVVPMPPRDGWHMPDKFGFPSGKESNNDNKEARKLWRWDSRGYVGLLARLGYYFGFVRRYVDADFGPSSRCGVLVEPAKIDATPDKELKQLAQEAEKTLAKMRGVVQEELLKPIEELVEVAKR